MVVKEIDFTTYSSFISEAEDVPLFSSVRWLALVREGFGVDVRVLGVFTPGGQLVAACPIEVRRTIVGTVAGSPLPRIFTPYQGLVWLPGTPVEVTVLSIKTVQQSTGHLYFRMQWQPRVLEHVPYDFQWYYTPLIDLSIGENELFRRMKAETRNQIRQAARRGVHVAVEREGGRWLHDYFRLSQATYTRQGLRTPLTLEFLRALFEPKEAASESEAGGFGRLAFLAYVGTTLVAASIVVHDDKTVYYLDNVSLREYQQYRANNAILWESIVWASRAGYILYDLVGANVPSIAAFKLGFGATKERFPVLTSMTNAARFSYHCYRLATRILGRFVVRLGRLGTAARWRQLGRDT